MAETPAPSLLPRPVDRGLAPRARLLFILLTVVAIWTVYQEALESVRESPGRPAWVLASVPVANVYAPDGTLLGPTPVTVRRPPGTTWTVRLEAAGYEARTVEMDFPETQVAVPRQTVELRPLGPRLDMSRLPEASTYSLDEGPEAFTEARVLQVTEGEHRLRVTLPGQRPLT
ncbi:MAG: PEGA domain-containing protein, partial [Candidatus Eremiobacterota bacterium]